MTHQSGINQSSDPIEKMEHAKYGQSRRTKTRTRKIIVLSAVLALSLLVLIVQLIYSVATISTLNDKNRKLEIALIEAKTTIETLKPELESTKNDLEKLVQSRFPNLQELVTNQVMEVDNEYIRTVVFTVIKQGNRQLYKYLLVVENDTTSKIKPSFRVLLFDQYGVHVATDEFHDAQVLRPGESRDYASDIDFFFDTQPKHFYIDDITAQTAAE